MMTTKLQIIIAIGLLIAFIMVLNMVRKKSLELKYALSWLIVAMALLVIVLVPGLLGFLAHLLGIYSVMNMIFFLGFCFLLIIVFSLTVALSRSSNRIKNLTQKMALYEKRLDEKNIQDQSEKL